MREDRHRIDVEFAYSDNEDAIEIRVSTSDGSKLTGQTIMDAVVDMLQHIRLGTIDDMPGSKSVH